jgi:hypothetical protein
MRINTAEIMIRSDIDADQLIDVIKGDKVYTKSLTILTKMDLIDKKELNRIKKDIKPEIIVSAAKNIGMDELKDAIYNKMEFIRIFLKEANKKADMEEPLIMFKGCTIRDVCSKLHKDFIDKFRFAKVWGKSAKFDGQKFIKLDKKLTDQDILEIRIR